MIKRHGWTILVVCVMVLFTIVMASCCNRSPHADYQLRASLYAMGVDGTELLKDEHGELWEVEGYDLTFDDALLLDMCNNSTPTDFTDDEIFNIWKYVPNLIEEAKG